MAAFQEKMADNDNGNAPMGKYAATGRQHENRKCGHLGIDENVTCEFTGLSEVCSNQRSHFKKKQFTYKTVGQVAWIDAK